MDAVLLFSATQSLLQRWSSYIMCNDVQVEVLPGSRLSKEWSLPTAAGWLLWDGVSSHFCPFLFVWFPSFRLLCVLQQVAASFPSHSLETVVRWSCLKTYQYYIVLSSIDGTIMCTHDGMYGLALFEILASCKAPTAQLHATISSLIRFGHVCIMWWVVTRSNSQLQDTTTTIKID